MVWVLLIPWAQCTGKRGIPFRDRLWSGFGQEGGGREGIRWEGGNWVGFELLVWHANQARMCLSVTQCI